MSELVHPVPIRALDADGNPVSGAELYAFRSGTSTPLTIYADSAGSSAHPVPLQADGNGVFAAIYNTSIYDVKIDVRDPVTNVSLPGYPIDPCIVSSDGSIAAEDVTFTATGTIAETDVQAAIEAVDANWRNAKTGVDDDIVSGTAGTDGNLAKWNVDGDLVDGPTPTGADAGVVTGTAGTDGNLGQWNADGDLVDGPDVLDEDDFASDSATAVATQQSIKAYVDNAVGTAGWTTLGTMDTATGTPSSVTLTSLTLTDYEVVRCIFDGVVGSGGLAKDLRLEGVNILDDFDGSTTRGFVEIDLSTNIAAISLSGGTYIGGIDSALTTASTSITFAVTAGTFAGGQIVVKAK